MTYSHILFVFLLIHFCDVSYAAFCSDDEFAGKCFDEKIKPMAIGMTVVAFILGISIILLAVALLCKAKRRQRSKVFVHRQPAYVTDSLKTSENRGFESASQYHVKRPAGMSYELGEPTYVMTRNAGAKPVPYLDERGTRGVLADEKSDYSPTSSKMMWVPEAADYDEKKLRSKLVERSGIYQ